MGIPAYTQGELKTTVAGMNIGDYIAAQYTTQNYGALGTISNLGTVDTETLDDYSSENLDGVIYLMKMAKGLLVSTSRLGNSLSYYQLSGQGLINGAKVTLNETDYLLRLPTFKEFMLMMGNLGGVIDPDHRAEQFGDGTLNVNEWVSNIAYDTKGGYFNLNGSQSATAPTFIANNTTTLYFRLVLGYVDNDKSTDLYH
jgi:hypothetical protein